MKNFTGLKLKMEAFDQLLTCCVCLDRYKNPKLLPCQHSYCMEPCMEGLVDYVKRQVKCPECRAEHRIPYNGIQGFPTNYTLTKFLELHAEITGTVLCLTYLLKGSSRKLGVLLADFQANLTSSAKSTTKLYLAKMVPKTFLKWIGFCYKCKNKSDFSSLIRFTT